MVQLADPESDDDIGPDAPDIDDARSDTSSEITELNQDEFPSYFLERDHRLFHSHGRSSYPLPVDANEQRRYDGQHQLLRKLIGDDFVGPVAEVLQCLPGEQQRVLDLGTGTGRWVLDMADRFPHVRFNGLDIVPIMSRYPPPNAVFEIHDLDERLRYDDGSFSLVHARIISMAVRDYPRLLQEVVRVLRPGGLYIACEWGRLPCVEDDSDPAVRAPRTCAFFQAILLALQCNGGTHPTALFIPGWVRDTGGFRDIHEQTFKVPMGTWPADPRYREIGAIFKETMRTYTESVRTLLLNYGHSCAEVQALIDGFLIELDAVRGLYFTYYTVHATRA